VRIEAAVAQRTEGRVVAGQRAADIQQKPCRTVRIQAVERMLPRKRQQHGGRRGLDLVRRQPPHHHAPPQGTRAASGPRIGFARGGARGSDQYRSAETPRDLDRINGGLINTNAGLQARFVHQFIHRLAAPFTPEGAHSLRHVLPHKGGRRLTTHRHAGPRREVPIQTQSAALQKHFRQVNSPRHVCTRKPRQEHPEKRAAIRLFHATLTGKEPLVDMPEKCRAVIRIDLRRLGIDDAEPIDPPYAARRQRLGGQVHQMVRMQISHADGHGLARYAAIGVWRRGDPRCHARHAV